MKRILAIETSCDETGIALVLGEGLAHRPTAEGKDSPSIIIEAEELASQITLHKKYGGVVPHLAAREHEKNLPILLRHLLKEARGVPRGGPGPPHALAEEGQALLGAVDLIAVTKGPGLSPALWRGINFAKKLSEKWRVPLLGIDHMEGHLSANFISDKISGNSKFKIQNLKFPILSLTVSGGHTQLVLMRDFLQFDLLGETLDDAAGEAFDKVARMLGLSYPGGPEISRLAKRGNREAFSFPRPMEYSKDYNFSFSGLKTAVLYTIEDLPKLTDEVRRNIAASFQQAVIDVLIKKTLRAADAYGINTVLLAGGVAANEELRTQLAAAVERYLPTSGFRHPTPALSGDNAAMIGAAAYIRLAHGETGIIGADITAEPARQITD